MPVFRATHVFVSRASSAIGPHDVVVWNPTHQKLGLSFVVRVEVFAVPGSANSSADVGGAGIGHAEGATLVTK